MEDSLVTEPNTFDSVISKEDVVIKNFVEYFGPLIENLDKNVVSLRLKIKDLE